MAKGSDTHRVDPGMAETPDKGSKEMHSTGPELRTGRKTSVKKNQPFK